MTSPMRKIETTGPSSAAVIGSPPPSDRFAIAPQPHAGIGPEGVWVADRAAIRHDRAHEEGVFSIAIRAPDGRRVNRAIRSRWVRTRQGRVEAVQIVCGVCSTALAARDIPVRIVGMFACQLSCPGCSRGMIACGSRRPLYMAIRLRIDDPSLDPYRRTGMGRPIKSPLATRGPTCPSSRAE
jgi:hypothetical protein